MGENTGFIRIACYRCKEEFGLGPETYQTLKRSSAGFHCPFGHEQHFTAGPTEVDKLRRERDRLQQDAARLHDTIRRREDERDSAIRRASAARGQVTRLKNRAAAGLCPCCNRSFVNLQRHMASKHAGFTAEEVHDREGATVQ